jgi:hypothetical protein
VILGRFLVIPLDFNRLAEILAFASKTSFVKMRLNSRKKWRFAGLFRPFAGRFD